MREFFHKLGLTEEAYRNTGIARRSFLSLTSLLLVAAAAPACAPSGRFPVVLSQASTSLPIDGSLDTPHRNPKLVTKVWTPQEISDFGASMYHESELIYNDIVYAGVILAESQVGRVSVSKLSHLFPNTPVVMKTIQNIGEYKGKETWEPTDNTIVKNEPSATFPLEKADGSISIFSGPSSLQLEDILIDGPVTSRFSDFVLRFHVAKELFNVRAISDAAGYLKGKDIDPNYHIPNSLLITNAVTIGRISEQIKGMPLVEIAKVVANFYMLPNYLLAVDQGRVLPGDWGTDYGTSYEAIFKKTSERFQEKGILFKNEDGTYEWKLDAGHDTWNVWIDEAVSLYGDKIPIPRTPNYDRLAA